MNVIQDAQFRRPSAIQDGQGPDGPPGEILKYHEKSPDSTTMHGSLLSVYPIIAQGNKIQIWKRKGYEHAAIEENERYAKLLEDRSAINTSQDKRT